jgi:hypothetical protein
MLSIFLLCQKNLLGKDSRMTSNRTYELINAIHFCGTCVPEDMDYLTHLTVATEHRICEAIENTYCYAGCTETGLWYLDHFYSAWNALKMLHKGHAHGNVACNICPSENEEILNALEDTVKRLDNATMEQIIEDIMTFVLNNEHRLEKIFFKKQWEYATIMLKFWKGLRDMSLRISISDLHNRAIGFRMRLNKMNL